MLAVSDDNQAGKRPRAAALLTLCLVLSQSQRSSTAMPPRSAQRHHFCPSLEGRHHHQALAGPAGEEPAGGAGHRSQRHPSSSSMTSRLSSTFRTRRTPAQNCPTAEPSVMDTDVFMRDCRRKKRLLPDYFSEQMCKLRACASVIRF